MTAARASETANTSEFDKQREPPTALDITLAYHERTKHRPFRFAPALGYMDWDTQPDPFRRFEGAAALPLDLLPVGPEPRYELAFALGHIARIPLVAPRQSIERQPSSDRGLPGRGAHRRSSSSARGLPLRTIRARARAQGG